MAHYNIAQTTVKSSFGNSGYWYLFLIPGWSCLWLWHDAEQFANVLLFVICLPQVIQSHYLLCYFDYLQFYHKLKWLALSDLKGICIGFSY